MSQLFGRQNFEERTSRTDVVVLQLCSVVFHGLTALHHQRVADACELRRFHKPSFRDAARLIYAFAGGADRPPLGCIWFASLCPGKGRNSSFGTSRNSFVAFHKRDALLGWLMA
jgi:hypothetical protein